MSFNSRVRAYFLKIEPQHLHDKPSSVKWIVKRFMPQGQWRFSENGSVYSSRGDYTRHFRSDLAIIPIIDESGGLAQFTPLEV